MSDWFSAHKDGLRQIAARLIERRGYGILLAELYQNVRDTDATECDIVICKMSNRPFAQLTVVDNNPLGFTDLTHAWTVFAPSEKKNDPTKAGRFNLGEKVVLAFCQDATIHTTKGLVVFDESGRKEYPRRKRDAGTEFSAVIRCTNEQFGEFIEYAKKLIVKPGLKVTVNGEELSVRKPIKTFSEALQTEIGDDLRKTIRQCEIQIFEPLPGETPMLYELGIPVVETSDKWDVSVGQKVPLNVDRDNVTPAYLRHLRTVVFNQMFEKITEEDTTSTWVNEATSDENCSPEAAEVFRVKKYGTKSVALDPTNPEANDVAVSSGYTVIPPRGLTPGQRENLYKNDLLLTSSQAFPDAGKGAYSDDPNARPVEYLKDCDLTDGMRSIREYTIGVAQRLIGKSLDLQFVRLKNNGQNWAACYGRGEWFGLPIFHYNVAKLTRKWFDNGVSEKIDELILHELGHEYEGNHLSEKYYDALTMLGAKLKTAALKEPEWFLKFMNTHKGSKSENS